MRTAFGWCLVLALLANDRVSRADDEKPADKIPELKILEHYVGVWDVAITSEDFPFRGGVSTTQWVLDGRFIEQTGELKGKDEARGPKIKTLMTYDPGKKVYRSWTFLTDGSTSESEGTWDAKNKTMKLVSRKDDTGSYFTTTANFSAAGVETWSIVNIDGTGKAISEFKGKNTRKAK